MFPSMFKKKSGMEVTHNAPPMEEVELTTKRMWCAVCKCSQTFFHLPHGTIWYCESCRYSEGTDPEFIVTE